VNKRLVLVGAGHAHLSVLRTLAAQRTAGVDVVLITPCPQHHYSGMLPGWVAGHHTQAQCQIDILPLARAAGVRLVLDQMVSMDAARRCIVLARGQQIEYDLLSLNVGCETDTSWLEILGDKLLPVKPLDNFFAKWLQILAQAKTQRGYRLVVVGAGVAGVEMALAAQQAFDTAGTDGRVDLIASESGLLPGHAKSVRARVQRYAARAGLRLHYLHGVGSEEGVMLSDGSLVPADHVIAATGARPAVWLALSKLAVDAQGYILVDKYQRSLSHPNVFAAGDVCAQKDNRPRLRSLNLLACGPRYAVASWGRWSAEGQWVWRWKDWIDRRFIRKFSAAPHTEATRMMEHTP